MTAATRSLLSEAGYVVVRQVMQDQDFDTAERNLLVQKGGGAGSRTLLDEAWCRALVARMRRAQGLQDLLEPALVAVQCTVFDKSGDKNWLVSLHQDLSIPVKCRVDHPQCAGWSAKEGAIYVQPPVSVLERLVAVRIHLDDCGAENGPLRMVPGSHRLGRLDKARSEEVRVQQGEMTIPVGRGGALVMKPLILHASSKSRSPESRRVLHFVFGPLDLPCGLEWRWAI